VLEPIVTVVETELPVASNTTTCAVPAATPLMVNTVPVTLAVAIAALPVLTE
jgi:hypothetical protein